MPFRELIEELIELIDEDADALGCKPEIQHTRKIIDHGTSADRQLARYHALLESGSSNDESLREIVDMLIEEFRAGTEI